MNNRSTKPRGTRTSLPKEQKLSRTHAPTDIATVEWQRLLRRQFGREQSFGLENIGTEPFFSEFRVSNPQSKSSYRVAIRGKLPGDSYCACPDYATNELGTCKHIEFVLAQLEKKRGAKAATNCAPTTMPSISSPRGAMRIGAGRHWMRSFATA